MKFNRLAVFWGVFAVMVLLDQALKVWVRNHLNIGESWRGGPLPGIFEITLTYNKGIAFGMFQGGALLMTPVAIVIAGFAIYTIYKNPKESRWSTVALGLLAAGAIGNLYDRLFHWDKGVTDMFLLRLANITHGRFGDFPVFNIADSCISVAMVMLLITWMKHPNDGQKAYETQQQLSEQEPGPADSSPLESFSNPVATDQSQS